MEEKGQTGIRRFTYNSRHQQTRVETETGNVQENRYDSEGLRYELLENGRRTSFVYHNGELLHEKGGETGLSREETSYHLGAGIEAFQRNRETFYYHQDEQMNITLISDGDAKPRNQYQYDAFGVGLDAFEELSNLIRYTGQQYDQLTNQYYLRARYYNPVLGRFMQEDVYQEDGLNLYAYCRNNPVIYYDPSGYECEIPDKIAGDGCIDFNGEITAGKNFKSHYKDHKHLLEKFLRKEYPSYKKSDNGKEFLIDLQKLRKDGFVKYEGLGTIKKDFEPMAVYRGNGLMLCVPVWNQNRIRYVSVPLGYRMWLGSESMSLT